MSLAAVFAQLSNNVAKRIAMCIGINPKEPEFKHMIRVETLGSGAVIANIIYKDNMTIYDLRHKIAPIIHRHPSQIGFMAGHGGDKTYDIFHIRDYPETTVFVMYISCSICGDFGPICYICECFRDLATNNPATAGVMLQKKRYYGIS
jgi:hypothetical protein